MNYTGKLSGQTLPLESTALTRRECFFLRYRRQRDGRVLGYAVLGGLQPNASEEEREGSPSPQAPPTQRRQKGCGCTGMLPAEPGIRGAARSAGGAEWPVEGARPPAWDAARAGSARGSGRFGASSPSSRPAPAPPGLAAPPAAPPRGRPGRRLPPSPGRPAFCSRLQSLLARSPRPSPARPTERTAPFTSQCSVLLFSRVLLFFFLSFLLLYFSFFFFFFSFRLTPERKVKT